MDPNVTLDELREILAMKDGNLLSISQVRRMPDGGFLPREWAR